MTVSLVKIYKVIKKNKQSHSNNNTYQEDVGNCIKNNEDGFAVFGGEEVQQRFQHVGLNEVHNLVHSASTGQVGHSPHSLLLGLVVTLGWDKRQGQCNLHTVY